jgi:hypothetical protein
MLSQSFVFQPAPWLPFRDTGMLDEIRFASYADRAGKRFENPEFELKVVGDAANNFAAALFYRIRMSAVNNQKLTLIHPSPETPSI